MCVVESNSVLKLESTSQQWDEYKKLRLISYSSFVVLYSNVCCIMIFHIHTC